MTTIEWTDESWNMIRARNKATGKVGHFCVKVSPGCRPCYAEAQQPRWGNPIRYAAQDLDKVELFLDDAVLRRPLSWRRGRDIFPCSMTDLFAPFHPDKWIDLVMAVAALTPHHTYQCLTKQQKRMRDYMTLWPGGAGRKNHVFSACLSILGNGQTSFNHDDEIVRRAQDAVRIWPLPNWCQGVSVEDAERANERIPVLLDTPFAVRWVSAEPIQGYVDLRRLKASEKLPNGDGPWAVDLDAATGIRERQNQRVYLGAHLDGVVVGGASGARAEETAIEHVQKVVESCKSGGIGVFVKQLGKRPSLGGAPYPVNHPKGGDPAEWPARLRVRDRFFPLPRSL
jgi:protein gp37